MLRLSLTLLLICAASLTPANTATQRVSSATVDVREVIDESTIRDGDLIFRRGRTWLSRAVVEADPASSFSHIGLAVVENGPVSVIHATPGDRETPAGVVSEPLSSYLAPGAAMAVGVWRVPDEAVARRAAETARFWAESSVPFDEAFEAGYDDASDEALYCTELVWKAYLYAGVDLLGGELDTLDLPLGPDRYVLLSSLMASAHVAEIPVARLRLRPTRCLGTALRSPLPRCGGEG